MLLGFNIGTVTYTVVLSSTLGVFKFQNDNTKIMFMASCPLFEPRGDLPFFREQADFELHGEATDGPEGFPRHEI